MYSRAVMDKQNKTQMSRLHFYMWNLEMAQLKKNRLMS